METKRYKTLLGPLFESFKKSDINVTKTNAPKLSSDEILVPTEHCFEFRRQGFVCSNRGLVTIGCVSYESFYVPGKRGDTNEMDS